MFELSEVAVASFYEELEKIAGLVQPGPPVPGSPFAMDDAAAYAAASEADVAAGYGKGSPPKEGRPEPKRKPKPKGSRKPKVKVDADDVEDAVEKGVKETGEAAEKSEISKLLSEAGDEVSGFVKRRPGASLLIGGGALGATALGTHLLSR